MRRFEFSEGNSKKFWEMTVSGSSLTVRWGRLGAKGQSKTKSFATDAEATKESEKLIAEKLRKGYREVELEGQDTSTGPTSDPENAELLHRDLNIAGKARHIEGSLTINGWLVIGRGGKLVCTGKLVALGAFLDEGSELHCRELVTNVLTVDGIRQDTVVEAERIRARLVDLVQLALSDIIERGDLIADYCQHFGGELNPSWDYRKGDLTIIRPEYWSARSPGGEDVDALVDEDVLVDFEMNAIRAALCRGENVFRVPLLVQRIERPVPRDVQLDHPLLAELAAWIEEHPGPQRATLDELETRWSPRLMALDADTRSKAGQLIRRGIKSPKLADRVAALLERLSTS